jgi:ABC-type uncharacterized transport system YnjBCD ATPase subunit
MNTAAAEASLRPIIEARAIGKRFGSFVALKDVSATFYEGQVTAIVGPSGSGKSTFLRTLNRLEAHDSGEIVIDGIVLNDNVKNLDAIRREVGMVFQSFNLFSHLSILRNRRPGADARAQDEQGRRRGQGAQAARARWPRQPGGQVSGAAFRRPATTGGHRAGAGHGPQGAPVRRADLGAGPGNGQRSAGRDARAGAQRHHHAGGDARDGFRARSRRSA